MPSRIDTKSVPAVTDAVRALFGEMYAPATPQWIDRLFGDIESCFLGRHPDYQAVNLRYHDLEHTLQATLCFARLMAGRHRAGAEPVVNARQFELGLAAVLLHDTGYLTLRSDTAGTGAKYTYTHVLRSCAFAASYLPTLGATLPELHGVLGAISGTGPTSAIDRSQFNGAVEHVIGCAVGSADFLGQMAAADYPDELEALYREFEESDDFTHVPIEQRAFKSVDDLIERTPRFWTHLVQPKLEKTFHGLYRFLAEPYPDGRNAYIEAIEANIAKVESRLAARVS